MPCSRWATSAIFRCGVSNLPRVAVCTLALTLSACFRLNPTFLLAGSDTSSPESGGEPVDSSGGPDASGSENNTTTEPSSASSPPSSSSSSSSGSTSTSSPGQTTTESGTTDDGGTGSTGATSFRRVFLTSSVFGAQLGGIAGADAKCQTAADSAGLGGTFRAWISTPTSSPVVNFVHSSEPYVRIDGVVIASSWSDLVDGDLAAPLEVDELGNVHNNGECGNVWTNTLRDGTPYDEDACTGWTSLQDGTRLGRSDVTNYSWTEGCVQDCLKQHHLFCVEQ